MAAFFLSLVAFLSFWSQQKERNEQNNSLRNGIFRSAQHDALKYRHSANCLSLRQRRNATNRVLEEEARSDHTLRVSSYIRLTPASVARISYASCHPEHSEGSKTFLHKDISLTLNMTPRHSMGVNHTPLAYSAYTPRTLKDSSPSLRVTGGDSAAPPKKAQKKWNRSSSLNKY